MAHDVAYDSYAKRDAGMHGAYFCRASAAGPFAKAMDPGLFSYCVMIVSGEVTLEMDFPAGTKMDLGPGDSVTVSGLARHRFYTAGADLSCELGLFERRPMNDHQPIGEVELVIGIAPNEALALSSLIVGPIDLRAREHSDLSQRAWAAVDMIDAEYAHDEWDDRPVVIRRLAEIIEIVLVRRTMLDHDDSGLFRGTSGLNVMQAVNAFFRSPDQSWTLAELAKQAGMSRTGFAKKFKSITGQTPARIVSRMRLTAIADRLISDSISIESAAEEAGYGSAAAFVRAFQREFGETPARWRRDRNGIEQAQKFRAARAVDNSRKGFVGGCHKSTSCVAQQAQSFRAGMTI